nr:MAG: ribose-phosphate pyrophosphokinase [Bacteroidota bacterium]
MERPVGIFAGRSNLALAERIAACFGQPLGHVTIRNFSDGEIYVRFEESIRGMDVYIIQSTHPGAENWLELLLMIDAARRASADRITAVIPYFGYARQDRKDQPRVSIASKLMADLLTTAGVHRVLTMDLHAPQIQGFFNIPVDHLYGSAVLVEHFRRMAIPDLTVVAPDVGSLKMARAYAKRLHAELAFIDKRRPEPNQAEVLNIIGQVKGRNILIVDDLIDTAGTLVNAARALRAAGAREIRAAATHPILSGPAYERIEGSEELLSVTVTDTVPLRRSSPKIEVLSVAEVFADAIRRIYLHESISTLFVE